MATRAAYTGDGSTTVYNIDIPFDDPATIFVDVNEVPVSFSWSGASQITLDVAPAAGSAVYIYRKTDVSAPEVVFQDAQVLIAGDLNDAIDQVLDSDQEQWDALDGLQQSAIRGPRGTAMLPLPAASDRAGKALIFDTAGNPIAEPLTVTAAAGQSVSTRALLEAIADPADSQSALLTEAGRNGLFIFSSANLSAEVAADPSQINYVAPAADQTGASGAWVRAIDQVLSNKFYGSDLGAIPDGVGSDLTIVRSFSGVGSSSGLYGHNEQVNAKGATNIGAVRTNYFGVNLQTTAGTTTNITGTHQYVWLQGAGSVADAIGVEAHFRADGPGTITNSVRLFNTAGTTLGSAITVPSITGYNAGQLSDATNGGVVTSVIGFNVEHQAATAVRGFRSQVRDAANAYSFLSDTNNGTEAAPAAFSGKVSIGNPSLGSAFAPSFQLDVLGNATDFAGRIANRSGANPWGLRIEYTAAAPNSTATSFLRCQDSSTVRLHIYSNGNVANVLNSYGAISDRRLKTDIRDASPQLADIRALRVRKYRLKSEGENGPELLGLVAQETEKVSPGLVYDAGDGLKGVNYSILYMKAVKALQELAEIVEQQGREIAALKAERVTP